jgi:murein DD-endopeptidase MepM/ murein hydrolase activator NlpD
MIAIGICHVSYGEVRMDPNPTATKGILTQEINQHRLKHSSVSTPPRSLKEERYRFILNRLRLPIDPPKKPESRVKIVPMDSLASNSSKESSIKSPLERTIKSPARRFDWTMMPPVKAKISQRFGEGEKKLSRGIVYTADVSQPVHAPIAGEIIFAGPIKDFGDVVMIEKDFENIILLAGISQRTIKQGEKVYRGQTLGAVVKRGWVYLEFRNEGNPIDPQQILISGNINEEE